MFEQASRLSLRFETRNGNITTEDLWNLPLISSTRICLDSIAKSLNKELKESEEESFVVAKTKGNQITELKFSIVKHIINIKLQENEANKNEKVIKQQKEKILGIIANKEEEELYKKSKEDLLKVLGDL